MKMMMYNGVPEDETVPFQCDRSPERERAAEKVRPEFATPPEISRRHFSLAFC